MGSHTQGHLYCFLHGHMCMCQCHLEQIKKLSGKKRAAEKEEAYAKRKAKVAAMNFDF